MYALELIYCLVLTVLFMKTSIEHTNVKPNTIPHSVCVSDFYHDKQELIINNFFGYFNDCVKKTYAKMCRETRLRYFVILQMNYNVIIYLIASGWQYVKKKSL